MILREETRLFLRLLNFILWSSLLLTIGCREAKESTPIKLPPVSVALNHEIRLSNSTNRSDDPILILLHGYGSNEKDLFSFSNFLPKNINVISPQAPIILQGNNFAWYDINRNEGELKYRFNEVKKAKNGLLQFMEEVKAKYNLNSDKVFIGGFSQGAIMSLYLGLTEPDKVKGVIALSGHLYPEVKNEIDFNKLDNLPSIFISHGRNDNVLSFKEAEIGVNFLESQNVNVDAFYYDSRHNISRENLNDMQSWLDGQVRQ